MDRDELKRKALSALHHLMLGGSALALLAQALPTSPAETLIALATGWIAGSYVEYAVHRHLFHGRGLPARVHMRHHARPAREQLDPFSYFGPLATALVVWAGLRAVVPAHAIVDGFAAGLFLQYCGFRAVHRRMHVPSHPLSRGALARFHAGHHADVRCNFGVTARLWDRLLGTRRAPSPAKAD